MAILEDTYNALASASVRTILWFLILTLIFKYLINRFRRDPRLVKFASQLPGPLSLPIVGNCWRFFFDDYISMFMKYEKEFGSVFRLWIGKHLVVVLTDMDDIKVVFGSSNLLAKPNPLYTPVEKQFGLNLFITPTHTWKKFRKGLQPFFVQNSLSKSVPDMNRIILKYSDEMEKRADGSYFDVVDEFLFNMCFDILTRTLFNFEISPQQKAQIGLDFARCVATGDEIVHSKLFRPWEQIALIDHLKYKQENSFISSQISKYLSVIPMDTKSQSSSSEKSELSFLQTVIQTQQELGLESTHVNNEIIAFTGAGSDLPAIIAGHFLLAVSMMPQIQSKLHEELDQRFGNDNRTADFGDIENLPYLDQVLKETQRRFISNLILLRQAEQDTKIGSYTYPRGSIVLIPVSNIHLNPKYYPKPLEFNPENFSLEAISKRPRLTFIPFSAGARNCIGKSLAELEMKLILIALLRRFEFSTTVTMEEIKLTPGFVISGLDGYKVRVKVRGQPGRKG